MRFRYFGYGSNMLTTRLKARCPSPVPIGVGLASGYRLEFSKRSIDDSGKATLIVADNTQIALGVVFEIDHRERAALDEAEGASGTAPGYKPDTAFPICLGTGETIDALTYLAASPEAGLQPYDWYLALIVAGAREHKLDREYLNKLLETPFIDDPKSERRTRKEALNALKKSGYCNWRMLLNRAPTYQSP